MYSEYRVKLRRSIRKSLGGWAGVFPLLWEPLKPTPSENLLIPSSASDVNVITLLRSSFESPVAASNELLRCIKYEDED